MSGRDTHTPTSTSSSEMKPTNTVAATAAEKRGGPKQQFPHILYDMLELANMSQPGSISNFPIAWCEHGRAFQIIDKVAFEGLIMPMFFKVSAID